MSKAHRPRTVNVRLTRTAKVNVGDIDPLDDEALAAAAERLTKRAARHVEGEIMAAIHGEPARSEMKPVRGTARIIR